jgi:DNA-binding FadR family transcriptional regulator
MSLAEAGHSSAVAPTAPDHGDTPPAMRLAAQVACRIEADVVRRGWPVGESLGSEPELRVQHGVSRAVLREAVRLVEHHQVARMRRGPNGGLFVSAPDAGPAARAMAIYLEYVGTSVDDLMQARQLLEPLAASLAARHLGEDGIELVRRTLTAETEEVGDGSVEALHRVLGELSSNAVLRLFIDVLIRLTSRYTQPSEGVPRAEYLKACSEARRRHAEIGAAVIVGDGGRAEVLLAGHLDGVRSWMKAHRRGSAPADEAGDGLTVERDTRAKLAEAVAGRLRDDIIASGWPVGGVIGSEADLLARYGISRAVLREAVRLLEHHSVARMRRGPGGGLVVATPNPRASIETMALYLEFTKVAAGDLLTVRDAIELEMVTRVTARHDEESVTHRLDRAVRWPSDGPVDGEDRPDHFHGELAELAGNPVLALFLRILTGLWPRQPTTERVDGDQEAAAEVQHIHRRIAEAVLAGDEGLARHRMRRHQRAGCWCW